MNGVSREWHLVAQESYLIRSCIASGLTDLRNASLGEKGRFYGGFFSMSIGLERLAKLTLIINQMQRNDLACPSSTTLRAYGHNLERLLAECQSVADDRQIQCELDFEATAMKGVLVEFLSRYARGLRYHNLDELTEPGQATDPLEEWDQILWSIFTSEVSTRKVQSTLNNASISYELLDGHTVISHHDLSRNPMNLRDYVLLPQVIDASSPYAVLHLIEIVAEVNKVQFQVADEISELGPRSEASPIPVVQEFYHFLEGDRRRHLTKKKWP